MKKANELSGIATQLGRKGGNSTLRQYGKSHYRKMAEKRWGKKSNK
jgi:hypothetical protein